VKAFEFRLERVLNVKRQRERLAELRCKQCLLELEGARARVRGFEEMLANAAHEAAVQLGQSLTASAWTASEEQAVRIDKALEQAEAACRQADSRYQQAKEALRQIAVEVEALVTLRNEQVQAHRLALQRAQQEQLDDVGLRRWLDAQERVAGEG
jgi:flagellar export protein FliJ